MARINIVLLSEVKKEDRFDAEFHKDIIKNPKLSYLPIKKVLSYVQYGLSREMNEGGIGTKIYRMNEIENMFCSDQVSKFAEVDEEELKLFEMKEDDVFFNRTN